MKDMDDFRIRSRSLMCELDATTNRMMAMVSAGRTTGEEWSQAVEAQQVAFKCWITFVHEGSLLPSL